MNPTLTLNLSCAKDRNRYEIYVKKNRLQLDIQSSGIKKKEILITPS